jgi:predicted RNase H-like HicB family nuclease
MTAKYEIVIYWSQEDNAFIAEVPELPGCMADGETYRQVNGLIPQRNWAGPSPSLKVG